MTEQGEPRRSSPMRMFDTSLRIDAAGPRGLPLVNNIKFLATAARYAMDTLAPFGPQPVIPVTANNGSIVVVVGEEAVRQVFTDNATFHRAGEGVFNLPAGQPWSGMFEAVITANGDEHKRRRRLLMPIVHKTALEHYQTVFAETFRSSKFAGSGAGERFDMKAELLRISKTNMLRCLLGLDDEPRHHELADDVVRLTDSINKPLVMLAQWDRSFTPYGRWVRQVASAYQRLAELIEARRGEEPKPDALSILCHTTDEDGERLTTEEIAGELNGLFAAGFETTATTMTWALLTMLANPASSTAAEEHDLTDDAVIDAVVKESQRVLPAVPISLPRRVMNDVQIAGSNPVPRGALLFALSVLEHHNPSVYPDPFAFRLSRWLADGYNPKPYEFFPFGVGARRCLGATFADQQARTTLGMIAKHDRHPRLITTRIDYRLKSGVVGVPKSQVVVEMEPAGTNMGRRCTVIDGTVTGLWKQ